MSKILRAACCLIAVLPLMQSCVDKDYDIDDLNKDAVFKIPPVPFGTIEKFYIQELTDEEFPDALDFSQWEGTPLDLDTIRYTKTVESIFTKDIVDKFFYEGADEDVRLSADVDVHLLRDLNGTTVTENPDFALYAVMKVTDKNNNVISQIKISDLKGLISKDNQHVEIRFNKDDFLYMKNASGMKFTFFIKTYISNVGKVLVGENYVQLKNLLLQTAGMEFTF